MIFIMFSCVDVIGKIKSSWSTEKLDEESVMDVNVRKDCPLNDIEATGLLRGRFSEQNGYDYNNSEQRIFAKEIDGEIRNFDVNNEAGEEYGDEEGNLSSDDSDVEIINAPLLPTWLKPRNLLGRIGSNLWDGSVLSDGEDTGKLASTDEIEEGATFIAHRDVEKFASPGTNNKVGVEQLIDFPSSHFDFAHNDKTVSYYHEVFQGMTIYVLNSVGVGMIAVGNVILNQMEITLQAFVLSANDRTEPP